MAYVIDFRLLFGFSVGWIGAAALTLLLDSLAAPTYEILGITIGVIGTVFVIGSTLHILRTWGV